MGALVTLLEASGGLLSCYRLLRAGFDVRVYRRPQTYGASHGILLLPRQAEGLGATGENFRVSG